MNNLKHLLTRPLKPVNNKVVIFGILIALIGFVDASYLTIKHFQGIIPPCSLGGGCEQVLTSSYSIIFGIPVSLMGALYYLVILIGLCIYIESKNLNALKWTLLITIFGLIASLYFIYTQVFILGSYCPYCFVSAITSTVLFVTAMEVFNLQTHMYE